MLIFTLSLLLIAERITLPYLIPSPYPTPYQPPPRRTTTRRTTTTTTTTHQPTLYIPQRYIPEFDDHERDYPERPDWPVERQDCSSNPCQEGGTCEDHDGTFTCFCTENRSVLITSDLFCYSWHSLPLLKAFKLQMKFDSNVKQIFGIAKILKIFS